MRPPVATSPDGVNTGLCDHPRSPRGKKPLILPGTPATSVEMGICADDDECQFPMICDCGHPLPFLKLFKGSVLAANGFSSRFECEG